MSAVSTALVVCDLVGFTMNTHAPCVYCPVSGWQFVDVVDPLLDSIEAITQRCQQTLSALAAAAAAAADDDDDDDDDTVTYFHTLEVSFLPPTTLYFMFIL